MEWQKELERHLQMLCTQIGARPTGSRANSAAVDYACRELERCGLQVHRQEFDCMDWTQSGASLTAAGQRIPVSPAPASAACRVAGELLCVGSLAELRTAQLHGKVVLLRDALAAEPLMPKSFVFWNPEEHKEILALLENGNPLAVLTVSLAADRFVPVIEDGDFALPCGVVLPGSLPQLASGCPVVLELNTERRPARAANVLATRGSGGRKVCFCAHIDTKAGTPGALDNASGVAVLLALAARLADRELPCSVEFVLFNGEDYYSTPGEMAYLAACLRAPEQYAFAFNVDGAGVYGCNTAYSFYECPETLMRGIAERAARQTDFAQAAPWPQGDHTLFAYSGVPAIAVISSGIFGLAETVLHTENDVLDRVDPKKLAAIAAFLADCLELAPEKDAVS